MSGNRLVRAMRDGDVPLPRPARKWPVDALLSIIAVIAVGSLAYVGLSSWLASRTPQPQAAPPALVSTVSTVTWTDEDTTRCKAIARSASEASIPIEFALANRAVTDGFSGMATLLECRLTTKVARFCDPKEKAALVAMINDYYARIDLVKLGMGIEGAPMAILGEFVGGEVSAGSAIHDMQRDATFAYMKVHHDKILAALRALGRQGLVSAPDFAAFLGFGVPPTITAIFKGVAVERQLCA